MVADGRRLETAALRSRLADMEGELAAAVRAGRESAARLERMGEVCCLCVCEVVGLCGMRVDGGGARRVW